MVVLPTFSIRLRADQDAEQQKSAAITSLFYIREWWPESFDTAHMVVWQSLIVFFALLVWVVWAVELSGTRQYRLVAVRPSAVDERRSCCVPCGDLTKTNGRAH